MPKSYGQYSVRWCADRAKWKSPAKLVTCAITCLMATMPYAFAGKEFPPEGSNSGTPFREECPPGQFMVGARYRSGNWMDQIAIICAPVDATGMTGPQWNGPPIGGNGGSPNAKSCPPGSIIDFAGILPHSGNRFVHMMDMSCISTTSTSRFPLMNVGAPSSVFPEIYQQCPTGEAVIGIKGSAGLFVDAIGMICGAFTLRAPSHPEPRPEACLQLKDDQTPEEWIGMRDAHNEKRKLHCVAPLTWSNELAAEAQAYAEECKLHVHGSKGENLADAWGTPEMFAKDIVELWYSEKDNYDFNNPQFKVGSADENGHFTQIVWKDTCQLGCGQATCEMIDDKGVVHKGTHWVCRYRPPGNVNVNDVNVLKQQVLNPSLCK